jgi:hypothetical protein
MKRKLIWIAGIVLVLLLLFGGGATSHTLGAKKIQCL